MDTSIIVALITGGVTLIGTIISVYSMNSKTLYRIEQLEKKMDKHNSVIERTYHLEKRVEVLDTEMKNVIKQIEDLED